MKKRLLLYFLIGCFLWIPNVFASEYSFSVCSNDCDFNDLDSALTAAEEYNINDMVFFNVYDNYYTISNHNLNAHVQIIAHVDLVIDGEGSTIHSASGFYMGDDEWNTNTFELKNLIIVTDNFSNRCFLDVEDFKQANLSNVTLEMSNLNLDGPLVYGLFFYQLGGANLDSVTINGFMVGINFIETNTIIKNSKLDGSGISLFISRSTVKTENTALSYLFNYYNGNVKLDLTGDKKVIYDVGPSYEDNEAWVTFINDIAELYYSGDYQQNLRIFRFSDDDQLISGSFSKTLNMDSSTINLFDIWFDEDDYEIEDFDIEVLNDDVVFVEDGVIKPLKGGKAVILLTDKNTGNEYRLSVSVDLPTITNPMTGNTFWFDFILVVFIFAVLGGYAYKKQHN